jgi:hypothetical protein
MTISHFSCVYGHVEFLRTSQDEQKTFSLDSSRSFVRSFTCRSYGEERDFRLPFDVFLFSFLEKIRKTVECERLGSVENVGGDLCDRRVL